MSAKILHVIVGLDVGGAELMLQRLVSGSHSEGCVQHSVISLTDLGSIGQQLQNFGVSVTSLGMKGALSVPSTFLKLRCELVRQQPDVVQTWMYHANLLGGLSAKFAGKSKVIWNVRRTNLHGNGTLKYLFRRSCGLFSSTVPYEIIYVSHSAQKSHVEAGYTTAKGVVIGNGFDTDKFLFNMESRSKYRSDMKLDFDDVAIFSVGRCVPEKDHLTFIKAICAASMVNNKIKGVLIGRDIDLESFDLSDIDKKNFIVLGEKDDISGLLSAADIFCLHSVTEGFPNVLGEAMSVGIPCITTKAGDAELILSNKTFTVETGDSSSIAQLMIDLSEEDAHSRKAIGNKNRERIINYYSLESILKKYLLLYK